MKKLLTNILALLLIVGMLSGCAKTEGGQQSTTPGTSTNVDQTEVQYKETLTWAHADSINTLDPRVITSMTNNIVYTYVHGTLLKYDANERKILPELATEWAWIDNTTLELKLRDDVYFHNGEKMTSDDVVYTIETNKDVDGDVALVAQSVKECVAVDDTTVRILLNKPNMDFLIRLSHPMFSIFNRKACEEDPVNGGYVGCGPYAYDKMVENDYVTVIRWDKFYGEAPLTKYITYRTIPEESSRVIALQKGEIDFVLETGTTQIPYVEEDANLVLTNLPVSSTEYMAFNAQSGPGSDVNFRLLIAHAINYEDMIIVGTEGTGTRLNSNWGMFTYGYNTDIKGYETDLEVAKQYLEKTPYREFTITVNNDKRVTEATILQDQLKKIGVKVNIEKVEKAALSAMTSAGEHQSVIYSLGWDDFGDDARRPYYEGSSSNRACIKNSRINELIDAALIEENEDARKEMYYEVQEINYDNAYYIPLFNNVQNFACNKNMSGYTLQGNKIHDFSHAYVVSQANLKVK